jgi:hypothetical protein
VPMARSRYVPRASGARNVMKKRQLLPKPFQGIPEECNVSLAREGRDPHRSARFAGESRSLFFFFDGILISGRSAVGLRPVRSNPFGLGSHGHTGMRCTLLYSLLPNPFRSKIWRAEISMAASTVTPTQGTMLLTHVPSTWKASQLDLPLRVLGIVPARRAAVAPISKS